MVSVIIGTHNRALLLRKCLLSIINQTYRDIEIIVIDDGSTDNTFEVVKSFQDERIVYINNGRTGNVSSMRNLGIKISKKPYIAFCDDDDVWMNNKLEVQLEYLKKEKVVCSNGNVLDENDKIICDKNTDYQSDMYFDLNFLLKDNRILTSSIIILKDVFDEIGLFNETRKSRCEDYDMWIRIASKYKIRYINRPLMSYRLHSGNLSRKSYFDAREVYETNISLLLPFSKRIDHEVAKSANIGITYLYWRLMRVSFVKGHFFDFLSYYKKYFMKKLNLSVE